MPRIAVIIPCFNDGEFVTDTVESVDEAEDVEVVIVDDGSTDELTATVLSALEARGYRVLRQRNAGVAKARMAGLGATSAPYVFPLDSDDLAVAGSLAGMADRLDANPEAALCYGDYVEFSGRRELMRAVPERLDPYRLAYTNEYPGLSMWRREALLELGGWQSLDVYEDWDLWLTFVEAGKTAVHAGRGLPTFRRRVHGERMGSVFRNRQRAVYRTLRARHPELFRNLGEYRRRSQLPLPRKLLYPVVYGGRRRFWFEPRIKAVLDRVGLWTLRR